MRFVRATNADAEIARLTRAARGFGVGRLAVERVIGHALTLGCRAIVLETATVLADAIRLYRGFGFEPIAGDDAGAFATLSPECEQAFRLDLTDRDC